MSSNKRVVDTDTFNYRSRRIKRIRRIRRLKICLAAIAAVTLLISPIVVCIYFSDKMDKMQDEIQVLKMMYLTENKQFGSGGSAISEHTAAEGVLDSQKKELADNRQMDRNQPSDTESVSSGVPSDSNTEEQDGQKTDKKVYLTFDDGPSIYTDMILDILKEYQVKATFFVIGKTDDHSKAMYKRIVEEGHTLGMHSYSHQYGKIYESLDAFSNDLDQLSDLLYDTTGYRSVFYRFPGGSANMVSKTDMMQFIRYLTEQKIIYFDWNVVNGDATGEEISSEKMLQNVFSGIRDRTENIVLMHDTAAKKNTVSSLPALLKELQKEGVSILPIDSLTPPVQQLKPDS